MALDAVGQQGDIRGKYRDPELARRLGGWDLLLQGRDKIFLGLDAPGAAKLEKAFRKKSGEALRLSNMRQEQRLLEFTQMHRE